MKKLQPEDLATDEPIFVCRKDTGKGIPDRARGLVAFVSGGNTILQFNPVYKQVDPEFDIIALLAHIITRLHIYYSK